MSVEGLNFISFTDVLFTQAKEDADAAKLYKLCKSDKILAIGNGVNPSDFKVFNNDYERTAHRINIRRLLKTSEDEVVLVVVGRLVIEKGYREFERQLKILQEKWNQLENTYKSGNKQELEQKLKEDKSFLPSMMMFGIVDMMMFSMMFSMIGASMGSFIPAEDIGGMDEGADDMGGSDMGDDGGFDIDIGF